MLIDLHVHTTRYSSCARSAPEEMAARAQALGLHGLVLTEHHAVWTPEELAELQALFPAVRLFRGVEITAEGGDDFLIYGPPHGELYHAGMPVEELLRQAHAHGNVAVLAHPYRYAEVVPDAALAGRVDGVEVLSHHIITHNAGHCADLAQRTGAWATAASDAHHTNMLGHYALDFHDDIADEAALIHALQARRYRIHVNPALVAAENAWLAGQMDTLRRLIAAGCSDREIRAKVPDIGTTTLRGIREGRNVLLADAYRPAQGAPLPRAAS